MPANGIDSEFKSNVDLGRRVTFGERKPNGILQKVNKPDNEANKKMVQPERSEPLAPGDKGESSLNKPVDKTEPKPADKKNLKVDGKTYGDEYDKERGLFKE